MIQNVIIIYLIIINIVAFGMYGIDKQKAIRKQWRIPGSPASGGSCHWRFCRSASWNAVFPSQDQEVEIPYRGAADTGCTVNTVESGAVDGG